MSINQADGRVKTADCCTTTTAVAVLVTSKRKADVGGREGGAITITSS